MTVRALIKRLNDEVDAFDTRALAEWALGLDSAGLILHADDEADEKALEKINSAVNRRKAGEPIQYIIGSWTFMGRMFKVGKGVLIPRDDTEVVVSETLSLIEKNADVQALDLCAGSGIIAVTLKKERERAQVTAVEKSETAFSFLLENAALNHADIRCVHADLNDYTRCVEDGSLDVLVSNPPYIKTGEMETLQQEVRFEPRLALDGGESGVAFYDAITKRYQAKIKPSGIIAFEIGEEQDGYVTRLLKENGFENIKTVKDIQGLPRAVIGKKRKS